MWFRIILILSRSEQFGVPVSFLQQQAYWLYEHELEQLKSEIQKGVQSAETIKEDVREDDTLNEIEETGNDETEDLSLSTKSFNVFETQTKPLRHVPKFVQLEPQYDEREISPNHTFDNDYQSDSDSSSSSSSMGNFNQESVFLHRSRILAKPPPTFNDSDDDEDSPEGFESIAFNDSPTSKDCRARRTTDSSLSNLSCM